MASVDQSLVVKQGGLKKQGGFFNSIWQSRSFALKAGTPPKLMYSNAASVLWDSASSSEDSGCISLSSSSSAAANPGKPTDFILSNVEYLHKASGNSSIELRAETEQACGEWVAAINAEVQKMKGGAGCPAPAPAPASAPATVAAHVQHQQHSKMRTQCEHYVRRCSLVSPCCDKVYMCRHCHNDAETHEIDRHAVKEVVCNACHARQPVSQTCRNTACGIQFAAYFCATCNFFDDRTERSYYHCDKCGICRVTDKGDNDHVHCDTCATCVSVLNHRCKPRQFHADCPVCLENLFHSIKPSNALPCGHAMHVHCIQGCFQQNRIGCPLCRKSMLSPEDWSKYNQRMDALIEQFPIQEEMSLTINCNDCAFNGEARFHPYGMKCSSCGGYNTSRK